MPTEILIPIWIWHDRWEFLVVDEKPDQDEIDLGCWIELTAEIGYWKSFKAAEKLYGLGKRMFISEIPQ